MDGGRRVRSHPMGRGRALLAQLLSFGAVGVATTYIDFIVFNLTVGALQAVPANVLGYGTGMFAGWLLNRRYTFGSQGRRLGLGIFTGVNAVGLILTSAAVQLAGMLVPGDRLLLNIAKLGAGGAVMLFKFVVLRSWVSAEAPAKPWRHRVRALAVAVLGSQR